MAEIHGDVVYDEYTGNYNRRCWVLDQYETISWASPTAGMRKAFIPEFFKTQKGVVMSGEGTSYTSSWIASALESGVRAATQVLLELGLVDEAKDVVNKVRLPLPFRVLLRRWEEGLTLTSVFLVDGKVDRCLAHLLHEGDELDKTPTHMPDMCWKHDKNPKEIAL